MKWKDIPTDYPPYNEETDTLIRQSIIGQCQLCEYRHKLESHKGYLPPVSEPMIFGTCEHYLIAADLEVDEPRLDLLASMDEWVEQILIDEYDWTLAQVPNVREFFTELSVAYRMWRTLVQPKLSKEIISLEEEMFLYLGESHTGNLFLKGTPDVAYPNKIVDWKTAGKGWKPEKAHLSIQASLYMALVKQHLDMSIRRFTFWVYNRQARDWQGINTERRVKDINAALITARDYAKKIESGSYTASPVPDANFNKRRGWYCSPKYCGAWNICPVKFLTDNKNENEIAIRQW